MAYAVLAAVGVENQPINTITWRHRARLTANTWNPNRAAPPERRLLRKSILENGWTQPIVVHQEGHDDDGPLYEIVDGYHRWLISTDTEISKLTDGMLPTVELIEPDPALARMATVRHNRARGTHYVLAMADIVAELLELGMTPDEIGTRLEMDDEEVSRLADRGLMTKRGAGDSFSEGWTT